MSTYVVSDNTIRAVLGYADEYDLRKFLCADKDALGQILLDENYRSVNHRYSEQAVPHKFVYGEGYAVSPAQAAQHIACIDYQSCETQDWETTQAFRLLARIRANVCRKMIEGQDLRWEAPE